VVDEAITLPERGTLSSMHITGILSLKGILYTSKTSSIFATNDAFCSGGMQ
jgi:hypothetical protein